MSTNDSSTAIVDNGDGVVMCPGCRCIAAALAEVGMDPDRVMCGEKVYGDETIPTKFLCSVGLGYGTEGLPLDEVERLCDKAIEVCARCHAQ